MEIRARLFGVSETVSNSFSFFFFFFYAEFDTFSYFIDKKYQMAIKNVTKM